MQPQGIFVATYLEGITEWVDDEWCPAPRFYSREHMQELITAQGLHAHFLDNVEKFEPPDWHWAVTHKWILIVHPEHETIEDYIRRFTNEPVPKSGHSGMDEEDQQVPEAQADSQGD